MTHPITALAMLLLVGCTTHGRIGVLPTVPQAIDAAEIVVIREWRFIGSGSNLALTLDGSTIYGLSTNEHVILRVPPGEHMIGVALMTALNEDTAYIDAVARRRYYFRVETALFGDGPLLQRVNAQIGEALMAKTSLVQ
jgi:hypothetical protein